MHRSFSILLIILFTFSLISCGSSSSDNNDSTGGSQSESGNSDDSGSDNPESDNPADDTDTDPPINTDPISMQEASRFLAMATLGSDYEEIERLSEIGYERWIEEQFETTPGYNLPLTLELIDDANGRDDIDYGAFRRYSWWQQVMTSDDTLRQRVAFALSEIFVVSDRLDKLFNHPEGLSSYYDVLLRNAFGNYRDLLYEVTIHPVMGVYLSHINNKKANPEKGRFPDENYARESMQLFSIGLDELNLDGTPKKDSGGNNIPTYDNSNITEFARVFTGLVSAEPDGVDKYINLVDFMVMNENQHDTEEKILLNGQVLPAGQTGLQDISDAVDNLFNHPNTGPFICRQLIQRLVTSNPSPNYVQRVAEVFNNNGFGIRGDFKAVIKAILLDEEALDPDNSDDPDFGKMQEPWIRYVTMLRAFNAENSTNRYYNNGYYYDELLRQHPLSAPSVFNFFLPYYQPNGILADNNLIAPEFQITNSTTIVTYPNLVDIVVIEQYLMSVPEKFFQTVDMPQFDFSDEIEIALNAEALVNRLDLILTYGGMSEQTKQIIISAIEPLEDPVERVELALYLVLISPDFVVFN